MYLHAVKKLAKTGLLNEILSSFSEALHIIYDLRVIVQWMYKMENYRYVHKFYVRSNLN